MPTIHYRVLNVFAETAFGGNPLAVVEDASELSDADMQAVARQFNLSETAFLLPSGAAAARVRIFTPHYEMAFAGHPTLGAAQVVSELFGAGGHFQLELPAGLIPVWLRDGRWTLAANSPTQRPLAASPAELAAMLGLPEKSLASPALWLNCGTEQALVELTQVEHVRACRPVPALLSRHSRNADGQAKVYVFARTPEGFEVRYFSMAGESSINEDPGTGSACANLGGWWLLTQGGQPLQAQIYQGSAVRRPCHLTLTVENGTIHVGGRVVMLGRGELSW